MARCAIPTEGAADRLRAFRQFKVLGKCFVTLATEFNDKIGSKSKRNSIGNPAQTMKIHPTSVPNPSKICNNLFLDRLGPFVAPRLVQGRSPYFGLLRFWNYLGRKGGPKSGTLNVGGSIGCVFLMVSGAATKTKTDFLF